MISKVRTKALSTNFYLACAGTFSLLVDASLVHAQPLPSGAPALAGAAADPSDGTTVDGAGRCVTTNDTWNEGDGRAKCLNKLIKRVPSPLLQTPGAFFVGYAWGSKSKQFVYGPQVGIGAAILFPVRRPVLKYLGQLDYDALQAGRVFVLPEDMSFTLDLAVSLNANLAAFTFPNASDADTGDAGDTQQAFNAGVYLAPQFGGVWWADGAQKRVAFALGILAGYLNTEATGGAFVLGLQPALIAQF